MVLSWFKDLLKWTLCILSICNVSNSIVAQPLFVHEQRDIGKCRTRSDIKALLHRYEDAALESIKVAFPRVTKKAWQKCQDLIVRTHRLLLSQLQISRETSDLYVPYSSTDLVKFAQQCIAKRGLRKNGITISFDTHQECSAAAGVQLMLHSFRNDFYFRSVDIKAVNIIINPRFWYNPKCHVTSQPLGALHTIHHEITHILEGHSIKGILIKAVLERSGYHPHDIDQHPAMLAYNRIHEYIADLMPCILNRRIADYMYKQAQMCKTGRVRIINTSPIHPTPLDLHPWLEAIISCLG